ncbi:hypothetical protein Agub_g390 [Astrephomene gubernaculifera]|uniref:Uncharacterized protein n=1 Tax=Astrephomene gubernaculifera TaxID=47775 RepID=A0AAD3DH37_9CHLO|nr:hypothetical protein Agub_g390 [Astrephomene gubernaculifera]
MAQGGPSYGAMLAASGTASIASSLHDSIRSAASSRLHLSGNQPTGARIAFPQDRLGSTWTFGGSPSPTRLATAAYLSNVPVIASPITYSSGWPEARPGLVADAMGHAALTNSSLLRRSTPAAAPGYYQQLLTGDQMPYINTQGDLDVLQRQSHLSTASDGPQHQDQPLQRTQTNLYRHQALQQVAGHVTPIPTSTPVPSACIPPSGAHAHATTRTPPPPSSQTPSEIGTTPDLLPKPLPPINPHGEPRATYDPALLATLPPLHATPSPSSLAASIASTNQQINNLARALSSLSSLACLSSLASLQPPPPLQPSPAASQPLTAATATAIATPSRWQAVEAYWLPEGSGAGSPVAIQAAVNVPVLQDPGPQHPSGAAGLMHGRFDGGVRSGGRQQMMGRGSAEGPDVAAAAAAARREELGGGGDPREARSDPASPIRGARPLDRTWHAGSNGTNSISHSTRDNITHQYTYWQQPAPQPQPPQPTRNQSQPPHPQQQQPLLHLSPEALQQLVAETARASASASLELYHRQHVMQLQQQLSDLGLRGARSPACSDGSGEGAGAVLVGRSTAAAAAAGAAPGDASSAATACLEGGGAGRGPGGPCGGGSRDAGDDEDDAVRGEKEGPASPPHRAGSSCSVGGKDGNQQHPHHHLRHPDRGNADSGSGSADHFNTSTGSGSSGGSSSQQWQNITLRPTCSRSSGSRTERPAEGGNGAAWSGSGGGDLYLPAMWGVPEASGTAAAAGKQADEQVGTEQQVSGTAAASLRLEGPEVGQMARNGSVDEGEEALLLGVSAAEKEEQQHRQLPGQVAVEGEREAGMDVDMMLAGHGGAGGVEERHGAGDKDGGEGLTAVQSPGLHAGRLAACDEVEGKEGVEQGQPEGDFGGATVIAFGEVEGSETDVLREGWRQSEELKDGEEARLPQRERGQQSLDEEGVAEVTELESFSAGSDSSSSRSGQGRKVVEGLRMQ